MKLKEAIKELTKRFKTKFIENGASVWEAEELIKAMADSHGAVCLDEDAEPEDCEGCLGQDVILKESHILDKSGHKIYWVRNFH